MEVVAMASDETGGEVLRHAAEDARRIVDHPGVDLRRDFPAWTILHTDRRRWWALRTGTYAVSEVIANDPETLRTKLREVEAADRVAGEQGARWEPRYADTS
jgi:hypothetical protein